MPKKRTKKENGDFPNIFQKLKYIEIYQFNYMNA